MYEVPFQEKNSVAQKKYDYVFAPPLLPGLLAAPMAIASQHSPAPQKYFKEKLSFSSLIKTFKDR